MTILITGSSSYIAQNLIKVLKKRKIDFIGIDSYITKESKKFLRFSILDKKKIYKIKKKIDCIVHLAAISNTNDAEKNPDKCFNINVNGTLNLLNFAKNRKIPRIIFASTEWVYLNSKHKINECSQKINFYKIKNVYAETKFLSEMIIMNSSFIKHCILRFGIIYGRRKKNFSVVEQMIKNLKYKDTFSIGSEKTMRSFIHIDDIVKSILTALDFKNNCISDIQGPEKLTLKKIKDIIEKILKNKKFLLELDPKNPSVRNVKNSLSIDKKKWKPLVSSYDGIKSEINRL